MSSQEKVSLTMPHQKIKGPSGSVRSILRLPGGQRIITCSYDGSLAVWDLESGTQIGENWKDGGAVHTIALSPDGKKVASGSDVGIVRLWDIDTGKVIAIWTGHTKVVMSICWSPEGRRVASGSVDGTARVWDVESGETILGPIETGYIIVFAVCYSPDGTKIATSGSNSLKVWNAKTAQLLTTLDNAGAWCMAWTSDGKTLISGSLDSSIRKFDATTWTQTAVLEGHMGSVRGISLSSNDRVLASASADNTARLWNLEDNQPIKLPFHHEDVVRCAAFTAGGKLLAIGCDDHAIYTWNVSFLIEAGLVDDDDAVDKSFLEGDATQGQTPEFEETYQTPQEFFGNARHGVNVNYSPPRRRTRLPLLSFFRHRSNPHGRPDRGTPTPPHQPAVLGRLPSLSPFRRRFNIQEGPDRGTPTHLHPLSWARHLVSGRGDGQAHPSVVEVACAHGKPRNATAVKRKPFDPKNIAPVSSRPPNATATQQPSNTTQNKPSSSQLQPAAATASTTLAAGATTAVPTRTPSRTDIIIRQAGYWPRFLFCVCCVPVESQSQ